MIQPFIVPQDGEVYNLSQMVKWKKTGDVTTVVFADGVTRTFTGEAAAIVHNEIAFVVGTYRDFQRGLQAATRKPLIATPDFLNGKIN